jgi:hypothetical protein
MQLRKWAVLTLCLYSIVHIYFIVIDLIRMIQNASLWIIGIHFKSVYEIRQVDGIALIRSRLVFARSTFYRALSCVSIRTYALQQICACNMAEGDQIRAQLPTESDSDYNAYIERMRQERLRKLQEEREKGPEFANVQLKGSKSETGEVTSPRKEEPTPEWVAKATQKREIVDPRAGREYNPKEERDVTAPWAKEKVLRRTVKTKEPTDVVKPPSSLNEPKAEIVKKGVASGGENPWGVSLRKQRETPAPESKKTSDRAPEAVSKQLKSTSSDSLPRASSASSATSPPISTSSPRQEGNLSKEEEEEIDRQIKEEIERQQREVKVKREAQQQQQAKVTSRSEVKKSDTSVPSSEATVSSTVSESEYNALLERVKALETFMETAQKMLKELTDENALLRVELKKANDTNESLEKKVKGLQDILEHL